MATFSPTDGANEREPTIISDGALQDMDGAEYRVGETGLFVARGRDEIGDIGSQTEILLNPGFDDWTSGSADNWTFQGTGNTETQETSTVTSGSAMALNRAGNNNVLSQTQTVSLNPSQNYTLSIEAAGSAAGTSMLEILIYNSTAAEYLQRNGTWGPTLYAHAYDITTSYQTFSIAFVFKSTFNGADNVDIIFRHNPGGGGANQNKTLYLDQSGATTLTGRVSGTALYEAGFDSNAGFIIAHLGNSIHAANISSSLVSGLSFSLIDNLPSGSSAIVGTHFANRHYIASASSNRRLELVSGAVSSFPIGMSTSTFAVGVSVTQGTGSLSTTTGLEYWVTEYDSTRGIESIHGSTVNTGIFSSKDGVVVTVTGTSANSRANQIRWYRSTDGGGYPDGGLIRTTAIGTTQITDTNTATGTLTVPQYGIISIGGLDTDRDETPPVLSTIFGPFQDSLLGVSVDEPRVLRFTPAGYPDSWPSGYGIPLETSRRDEIVTGVVLPGRIGVFCIDSVHVIYRLPRDSDSVFAAGEAQDVLTPDRGCVSRRGATTFTAPGSKVFAVWVSRDGIWATDLVSAPVPLTDNIDWDGRINVSELHRCRLVDDPTNRRLAFIHRRASDTTHNTGIWYLDYQQFNALGMRITFADHGPLADAVSIASTTGKRQLASIDSRANNLQVYLESTQDADDSQLRDTAGSVRFRMRTKEFLPAGPTQSASLGKATWMHDAGPPSITHRFYFNRRENNPEVKQLPTSTTRNASAVMLNRNVNSVSLEIESTGTISYGVHWVDIEGFAGGALGGRGGA